MSLEPVRVDRDTISIPKRAEFGKPGDEDYALGDGWVKIGRGEPGFDQWDQYLRVQEGAKLGPPVAGWARRVAGQM